MTGIPNDAAGIAIDHHAGTVLFTEDPPGTAHIYLVSERTAKVTGMVKVGFLPDSVTVDPVTGNVYVPVSMRNVVTELHV